MIRVTRYLRRYQHGPSPRHRLSIGYLSNRLSIKLKLGHPSRVSRLVPEHMAALVALLGLGSSVFTRGYIQRVAVLPSPCGAGHVVGGKDHVREVLPLRIKTHDPVRREDCYPEVAFCATVAVSIARVSVKHHLLWNHTIGLAIEVPPIDEQPLV